MVAMPAIERRNVLLAEFDSFPGDKNNCSFEEIISFLSEKIVIIYLFIIIKTSFRNSNDFLKKYQIKCMQI